MSRPYNLISLRRRVGSMTAVRALGIALVAGVFGAYGIQNCNADCIGCGPSEPLPAPNPNPPFPIHWSVNIDAYQTDPRDATDFDIKLKTPPQRIDDIGINNYILGNFSGASYRNNNNDVGLVIFSGGVIPNSPTTKRHFGVEGYSPYPPTFEYFWTFPGDEVILPGTRNRFDLDIVGPPSIDVSIDKDFGQPVILNQLGVFVSPSHIPLANLTFEDMPPNMFSPVDLDGDADVDGDDAILLGQELSPGGASHNFSIQGVDLTDYLVVFYEAEFSNPASGEYGGAIRVWHEISVASLAIPEPSSLVLVACACAAMGAIGRRRSRNS